MLRHACLQHSAAALILAFGIAAAPASAQVFIGTLSGDQEVPPADTPGSGTAIVTVSGNSMDVNVVFMDLLGPTTAAHIHCCAPPGANAGVASPVPTFPGFPAGVTSGVYHQVFDLALASFYNPAFLATHGGDPLAARDALVTAMVSGNTYFNIHTTSFPGGEIRGQLIQQSTVTPEPVSLVLLGSGLAGLGAVRRRRRRMDEEGTAER
jgi:hypothetical protein